MAGRRDGEAAVVASGCSGVGLGGRHAWDQSTVSPFAEALGLTEAPSKG